jgi:hypothetical protein
VAFAFILLYVQKADEVNFGSGKWIFVYGSGGVWILLCHERKVMLGSLEELLFWFRFNQLQGKGGEDLDDDEEPDEEDEDEDS